MNNPQPLEIPLLDWLEARKADCVLAGRMEDARHFQEAIGLAAAAQLGSKPVMDRSDYASDAEWAVAYNAAELALRKLQPGDLVRHCTGRAHIVIANDGKTVTAIESVTVTNPLEWKIVRRLP